MRADAQGARMYKTVQVNVHPKSGCVSVQLLYRAAPGKAFPEAGVDLALDQATQFAEWMYPESEFNLVQSGPARFVLNYAGSRAPHGKQTEAAVTA